VNKPCIFYLERRLYRLDDDPPILLGTQQDDVLHSFLVKQYFDGMNLLTSEQRASFDSDEELHDFLWRTNRLRVTVRMTTEEFREDYGFNYCLGSVNFSAVMKSLKRGPLGPAIDLPGHEQKGQGYLVRIKGFPEV
jgi:hypothetical protein